MQRLLYNEGWRAEIFTVLVFFQAGIVSTRLALEPEGAFLLVQTLTQEFQTAFAGVVTKIMVIDLGGLHW